ncbi:hypothetical protein HXA34_04430 [Salipaludibacillus agaradhaerens]|uniref:hypothetical protein n=1 Tax=Salipaludibacillus agaradhaerens TaxID=76935 RepID=UPI00215198FF|nr:hypothetical protein [Salipaludibacillus agaradhaerens]MCR6105532.1 hypothetical protein [Salipaludibacillus agaradhaerens]MCR6117569.1 hypothetical protein [Salipaludibacillus agaradhaerens]UJW56755.1 hypothetical protein HXZ66_04675 [Bacillus sp. A116_S68]
MNNDSYECDKELEELENELEGVFKAYQVKKPSNEETESLIQRLQSVEDALPDLNVVPFENAQERLKLIHHIWMQAKMTRWYMWLISFLFITMLTLMMRDPVNRLSDYLLNPLAQFLPLLVGAGVFYTIKTWNKEMRMVEMITPFPPTLLLFSKLFVLLSIQLMFALGGSIYLWLTLEHLMFVPFMLSWLAPLVFITGAFVVFVAWLGSIKGVIIGSACLMLLMTNFHSLISMATSESEMNYYGALLIILGCGVVMLAGSYLKGKQYDNTDVRAYNRS